MKLHAKVSASPFDEHYQMAFIYCVDQKANYCLSLSRFPGRDEIEIMVADPLVCKVNDVTTVLSGRNLRLKLRDDVALRLDGGSEYEIDMKIDGQGEQNVREALSRIFEGKSGLTI